MNAARIFFLSVIVAVFALETAVFGQPMIDPTTVAQANGSLTFLQNIQTALRNAINLRVFKFPIPCQKCQDAKLGVQDFPELPPSIPLGAADAQFFITKLSDPSAYVPGDAQKAMPFIADYGLLVEGPDELRLLLLSTYSQSVRLITSNREGMVLIGNIDPIFPDVKDRLARIFK